jgi:Protein of unknown function (DUF664)
MISDSVLVRLGDGTLIGRTCRSNAILAQTALDGPPKQPDPDWATRGVDFPDVRSVVMHMVTETAVQAGHLDAVRELIDGRQWLVL